MSGFSMKGKALFSFIAARMLVCIYGAFAVSWAVFVFPFFSQLSTIERIEKHVIAGDAFKSDVLISLKPTLALFGHSKLGRPFALRGTAVIDLRLLEQAFVDGDQANIDYLMRSASQAVRKSLANSPADPFLWLVLFWLENSQSGFSSGHLQYLEMSYKLGPNEGWLAVKRNRFALAIFPSLQPDLAEYAIGEFARLVGSSFFDEAANILAGPGWLIRERLLPRLDAIGELNRQVFGKIVYRLGRDVSIPGVERPVWRPWH
jgi:hypothetical protein